MATLKFTTEYIYVTVLTGVTLVALIILGRNDYVRSIVVYCMYALTICWVALDEDDGQRLS